MSVEVDRPEMFVSLIDRPVVADFEDFTFKPGVKAAEAEKLKNNQLAPGISVLSKNVLLHKILELAYRAAVSENLLPTVPVPNESGFKIISAVSLSRLSFEGGQQLTILCRPNQIFPDQYDAAVNTILNSANDSLAEIGVKTRLSTPVKK